MNKLLYHLLHGLIYLLSLLPFRVLYILSDGIYLLVYYVVGYRRRIVRKNLTESFPEKSEKDIVQIEKAFYHWFCDLVLEAIKQMTMSTEQMKRHFKFKNVEQINGCAAEGQSCGIMMGHYCNWEWVTSLALHTSSNVQCCHIYHPLENKDFDRLFLDLRDRMGSKSIKMAETLRELVKYQQQKQLVVVGYICDQVPFWNNIHYWTDFLNHDTPVLTGTEKIMRKLNHAVFYLDMKRVKRGYYEGEFILLTREPGKLEEFELTERFTRLMEKSIQRDPPYWLWTHNRWKRTREEWLRNHVDENGRVRA